MKKNLFLYSFLLLVLTQCLPQSNKNKSEKSVVLKTIRDYKNKTWPQYRGLNGDGKVESEYVPSKDVEISWEFEYQGGEPTPIVIDKGITFFGTTSKDVYAIDSIGNLKWTIKLDAKISYSLLISNDVLVVAPDSTMVYGLNASNGDIIWKRDFSYKYKSYISDKKDIFGRTIITDPNKYIIKKRGRNEAVPILENNKVIITTYQEIVALDIKTGETQYKFNKHEGKTTTPIITKDYIYLNNTKNHLYALEKSTNAIKWKKKVSDLVRVKPLLYNDTIYLSSYYLTHKVNKISGEGLGILSFLPRRKNAIIDNGIYYGCKNGYHTKMGTNFGSYVESHNLTTEEENWSLNIEGKYISNLIMVGDYIYFGDSLGNIRAIEKVTGNLVFKKYLGGSIIKSLSYANGLIYGYSNKADETNLIFAVK